MSISQVDINGPMGIFFSFWFYTFVITTLIACLHLAASQYTIIQTIQPEQEVVGSKIEAVLFITIFQE